MSNDAQGHQFMIDLTPPALKTPEGKARVEEAMRALDDAKAEAANGAMHFLREHGTEIRYFLRVKEENSLESLEDLVELEVKIKRMRDCQEEFFKALSGRQ